METYNSKRSKIIVTKVIEMAKELGMKVISEGVETEEQFELLKEVNVIWHKDICLESQCQLKNLNI